MGTVRIVCISDTHLVHEDRGVAFEHFKIPDGDILVHSGDATFDGSVEEIDRFASWFRTLPHKHKVFVAGNHDRGFQDRPERARRQLPDGVIYLQDSGVEIMGLKFYGAPWQPEFQDWAFNLPRGEKLRAKWSLIPNEVDVLVTHGPPHGVLDLTWNGEHVGCEELHKVVFNRVEPRLHIFGHIHHSGGSKRKIGKTTFVNAAILNDACKWDDRSAITVDLEVP
jgi:Icc-related predicted phosphoesterase